MLVEITRSIDMDLDLLIDGLVEQGRVRLELSVDNFQDLTLKILVKGGKVC